MALIILHRDGPEVVYNGLFVQTPRSGSNRVGTYAEVVDSSAANVDVQCADASGKSTPEEYALSSGYLQRDETAAGRRDREVRKRLEGNDSVFRHLMFCAEDDRGWFEDSMSVALIDADLPSPERGWEESSDGTALLRYPIATSIRDARALGKMHRTMQARGADLSYVGMIQVVHADVEAPISLYSSYLHDDNEYALYRPEAIFQTMYPGLDASRGDIFDPSTHYSDAGLVQP